MARAKGGGVGRKTVKQDVSRFLVRLENIEQQNRATIAAVFGVERRLNEKIDGLESRLLLRIEALEIAVRKNSEDIRKNSDDIRRNSEDIRRNSEDIAALSRRVDELAEALKQKPDPEALKALEARVTILEQRLGLPTQ